LQGQEAHTGFPEQPMEIREGVYESWNEDVTIVPIHVRKEDISCLLGTLRLGLR
jgi:hypothetical protein